MIIPFLVLGLSEPDPPKEPGPRTIRVELPDPLCRLPLGQEALPLLYAVCRAVATGTSPEIDAAPQLVAWWFAQGLGDDDLDRLSDQDARDLAHTFEHLATLGREIERIQAMPIHDLHLFLRRRLVATAPPS